MGAPFFMPDRPLPGAVTQVDTKNGIVPGSGRTMARAAQTYPSPASNPFIAG